MALFVNQNDNRSELQNKIAADIAERAKTSHLGDDPNSLDKSSILQESQEATGRSLFWVGVITMVVLALVIFVLFIFNGI